MSEPITTETAHAAFERGRRVGLATSALALGVVCYVNLLGIEKSLLAIVLAILALRGAAGSATSRFRGRAALLLSSLHAITVVAVVVLFHEKLTQLFKQVVQLYHTLS